jgi:uncharacterized protein YecE (DUF72 family)
MEVYIGCSGFRYEDWKNHFYPGNLSRDHWLEYYSQYFNSVEINHTFYSYPREENLRCWLDNTPDDFRFSIKAHRFFSHQKKLETDASFLESLDEFQSTLHVLKEKLGCVLWQLPGNFHKDVPRFQTFCSKLDRSMRHAIEFRHPSWFNESVYEILRECDVSYCILSAPNGLPEDLVATNKTAYLRFHGKSTWYNYLYTVDELFDWKERLDKLNDIDQLFIYFNNDHNANAIQNANNLKALFNV